MWGDEDEHADLSSDAADGIWNFDTHISPPDFPLPGSCVLYFDVLNNSIHGPILEIEDGWWKTSGEFDDDISHSLDASVWFNISVTVNNILPVADFIYEPISPTINDIVYFTDTSNDPDGDVISWIWDFSDGNISTDQNPTHRYIDNGTYPVNLTVMDDKGAIDFIIKIITVDKLMVYVDSDFNFFRVIMSFMYIN